MKAFLTGRSWRLLPLLPLVGSAQVPALDLLPDWDINASNTIRGEVYKSTGDTSASPYRKDGAQKYDEFNLNLARQVNPWNRLRFGLDGLVNDSFYRSSERGLTPERLQFGWERGDTGLPFRLQAGDIFGFFSYRLLQRSLKGVQFELQPRMEAAGRRTSLQFLLGSNQRSWKDLQFNDDLTQGVSWVLEDAAWGRLALNAVGNYRARDTALGLPARRQWVESLAGEMPFSSRDWQGSVEAEFSYFSGDHNPDANSDGQNKEDTGVYVQFQGRSRHKPFAYRLRYERYGEDFQPNGAVVTANRRSYEAHGDYRLDWGATLRARALHYDDAMESGNPLKTTTYGMNYSGRILGRWDPRLSGGVDAYWQERFDRVDRTDSTTRSLTASISRPLNGGWTGDISFNWISTHNHIAAATSAVSRNLNLGLAHTVTLYGWRGTFRPAVSLIHNSGNGSFDNYAPSVALQLVRGRHRLQANLNLSRQKSGIRSGIDTDSAAFAFRYAYQASKRDAITLDMDLFAREADPGRGSEAYRLGLAWRHSFNRPHLSRSRRPSAEVSGNEVPRDRLLTEFAPGSVSTGMQSAVAQAGLGAARRIGPFRIYEVHLLPELDLRQRFVLDIEAGVLQGTDLVIDFDSLGDPDGIEQRFERVREILLRRYGPADRDLHRGAFGPSLGADLQAGSFVRAMEWDLPGGVLRFGIPRRVDGIVRMELRYARELPSAYDGDWSITELP